MKKEKPYADSSFALVYNSQHSQTILSVCYNAQGSLIGKTQVTIRPVQQWFRVLLNPRQAAHIHYLYLTNAVNALTHWCRMNLEAQTLLRPALTEHDHDCLDELDGRPLAVDRTAGMRRKNGRLLLDVGVDPHVDNHHHQEHHQVGRGPEDQVAPAEDGSQL